MKKTLIGFLFALLFIFPGKGAVQEYQLDVPYVSTPYKVVEEMLRITNVGKDDVLYDLGSGDGRIVITAAKEMGCRGVGVDIDPQRIEESRENAAIEHVTDRVQFLRQNLFEADISEATVVTLYLLQTVNLKLRPKLLLELKPGTRVVSHAFSMGEWKPDKTSEVRIGWENYNVYYWVIPANVTGTWEWTIPTSTGKDHYVLKLFQQFQELKGTLFVDGSGIPIEREDIIGDKLQFTIERKLKERTVRMLFTGRVSGNSIVGSIKSEAGSEINPSKWKAQRDPSTVTPIDPSQKDLN